MPNEKFTLENYNPNPNTSYPRRLLPDELLTALDDVDKMSDGLTVKKNDATEVKSIFHFTTINALFNIIKYGTLHFGENRFMNDPNDGIALLRDLQVAIRDGSHMLWKKSREYSQENVKNENLPWWIFPEYLFFLMCFSKNKKSVAQWMMYADCGRGVCIEFDAKELLFIVENQLTKTSFENERAEGVIIDYNSTGDESIVGEMIEKAESLYDFHSPILSKSPNAHKTLVISLTGRLWRFCQHNQIAMKDNVFSYEEEYRIFIRSNLQQFKGFAIPGYDFKLSGSSLKPFREIKLGTQGIGEFSPSKAAIKKIWLGSNCPDENLTALRMMVNKEAPNTLFEKSKTVFSV